MRGGARAGAGKKRKSLDDKISEGKITPFEVTPNENFTTPNPKEYISAQQEMGIDTYATEIYNATYEWLKGRGCAELVAPQLIESYSQVISRHIQCEEFLSKNGLTGKHPTTGEPVISPFVKASLDYLKSANQLWYQIFQIVRENSTGVGDTASDAMEKLLAGVK